MERKRLLCEVVSKESTRFTVSRVVEQGVADFYELVKAQNLERIVAKRRDSRYYFDKRTKGWIKIKYVKDKDFVVCGYARGGGGMNAVLLGQYQGGQPACKGLVSLGVRSEGFRLISARPTAAERHAWGDAKQVHRKCYEVTAREDGFKHEVVRSCCRMVTDFIDLPHPSEPSQP